jgi:YD repeat-containing protein
LRGPAITLLPSPGRSLRARLEELAGRSPGNGHDDLGRLTWVQEPRHEYPTITVYDPNTGRVTKVRKQVGASEYHDTEYGYDSAGRVSSITNADSKVEYMAYTPRGELHRTWTRTLYPVDP